MSEKTEYPTPKRLRKAREDGQVAHSKDVTQTVLILALFGYMLADGETLVRRLGEMMVMPLGVLGMDFEAGVNIVMTQLLRAGIAVMVPFLLIVIGLGLFVEMLQTGMLFALKSIKPSAKKLNVVNNVKNVFSKKNLVEFIKSNLKIAVLTTVIYTVIKNDLSTLLMLPLAGVTGVAVALALLLKSMILKIAVCYAIIAAADFAWQRHNHTKQLMMSKDEVKQEYKEAEGDPHIKHQRKHLHQEMLQEGAVQRSREASVVVTNPTHLAIAVLYDDGKTPLPVVLAKGEGALAERMVVAARESGVPVLQNIPLAWALMETASIDQYIPAELVEPVAQVLLMVRNMGNEEGKP